MANYNYVFEINFKLPEYCYLTQQNSFEAIAVVKNDNRGDYLFYHRFVCVVHGEIKKIV